MFVSVGKYLQITGRRSAAETRWCRFVRPRLAEPVAPPARVSGYVGKMTDDPAPASRVTGADKTCPVCRRINTPIAACCDCGFDFTTNQWQAPDDRQRAAIAAMGGRRSNAWLMLVYPPLGSLLGALLGIGMAYSSDSHGWFGAGFDAMIYAIMGGVLGFGSGLLLSIVSWVRRRSS